MMKLKVILFLFVVIFLVSGAAFAMPQIEEIRTLSEQAVMLLGGFCLIGISSLARMLFSKTP